MKYRYQLKVIYEIVQSINKETRYDYIFLFLECPKVAHVKYNVEEEVERRKFKHV